MHNGNQCGYMNDFLTERITSSTKENGEADIWDYYFQFIPISKNENDTNGRWVIQFNQWTAGSISAYSQKAARF